MSTRTSNKSRTINIFEVEPTENRLIGSKKSIEHTIMKSTIILKSTDFYVSHKKICGVHRVQISRMLMQILVTMVIKKLIMIDFSMSTMVDYNSRTCSIYD